MRERIEESKNVQTTTARTYCKRSRPLPLPYYHLNSVGLPGTGSLPRTIAPPDHPCQKGNSNMASSADLAINGVVGSGDGAGYNFQCRGVLLIWLTERQGPTVLAAGSGIVVWIFVLSSVISFCLRGGRVTR